MGETPFPLGAMLLESSGPSGGAPSGPSAAGAGLPGPSAASGALPGPSPAGGAQLDRSGELPEAAEASGEIGEDAEYDPMTEAELAEALESFQQSLEGTEPTADDERMFLLVDQDYSLSDLANQIAFSPDGVQPARQAVLDGFQSLEDYSGEEVDINQFLSSIMQ